MDIVVVASEAVPFAKTGGLADVCGTLPRMLSDLGHNVSVIIPAFRQAMQSGQPIHLTELSFTISLAGKTVSCRVLKSSLPDSHVPVYLIDQPHYFDRDGLYGDSRGDFGDNCERFAFFCRAVLHTITQLGLNPDVVHCHDWQTGLIPAYISTRFESHDWMHSAATVMTIHNLAYQGQFWHWDMLLTGLGWEYFNWQQMEFYGQLNLLKTGIVFANRLSTVSPRYAQEIQTPDFGCALDGVLRTRRASLIGITNGIDNEAWDPAHDEHLDYPYDVERWEEGKQVNRQAIMSDLGISGSNDLPLVGLVGRLADQKGWDLVIDLLHTWLSDHRPVCWVVLGTGDGKYHHRLSELARQYPDRLGLYLGFSDRLAHRIEAGADVFLMPSHYEPCGLNQLYSLRYGAVPVVNPVGGLADTVMDTDEQTIAAGTATGFLMKGYSTAGLAGALDRALNLRSHNRAVWSQIVRTGMQQDWSWEHSAMLYEKLFEETISREAISH